MKQYNKEEYLREYPSGVIFFPASPTRQLRPQRWQDGPNTFCSCTRFWKHQSRAWEDCPNCLGYGIMPIPWSEVK